MSHTPLSDAGSHGSRATPTGRVRQHNPYSLSQSLDSSKSSNSQFLENADLALHASPEELARQQVAKSKASALRELVSDDSLDGIESDDDLREATKPRHTTHSPSTVDTGLSFHATQFAGDDGARGGAPLSTEFADPASWQPGTSGGAGSVPSSKSSGARKPSAAGVGQQKKAWDPLPITHVDLENILAAAMHGNGMRPVNIACPAGFHMTVYNSDISQHFHVPSQDIQVTRGSLKYVDHHARYGPQTRFRFQLCHNFLLNKCPKLSECSYIHATRLPPPSQVHLNPFAPRRLAADKKNQDGPLSPQDDPNAIPDYPTLPAGFHLAVFPPNSTGVDDSNLPPQIIETAMIMRTIGGDTAMTTAVRVGQQIPAVPVQNRSRHCAHFQFKRLCNLGDKCHFIHSKVPYVDPKSPDAARPPAGVAPSAGGQPQVPRQPPKLQFHTGVDGVAVPTMAHGQAPQPSGASSSASSAAAGPPMGYVQAPPPGAVPVAVYGQPVPQPTAYMMPTMPQVPQMFAQPPPMQHTMPHAVPHPMQQQHPGQDQSQLAFAAGMQYAAQLMAQQQQHAAMSSPGGSTASGHASASAGAAAAWHQRHNQ